MGKNRYNDLWWTSTYCRLIAAPDDIAIGWCYDCLSNSRYKACEHYHLDLPYEDTSGAKSSGSKQKEHTVEFTDFPPDATEDADDEDESQTQVSNNVEAWERETLKGEKSVSNQHYPLIYQYSYSAKRQNFHYWSFPKKIILSLLSIS